MPYPRVVDDPIILDYHDTGCISVCEAPEVMNNDISGGCQLGAAPQGSLAFPNASIGHVLPPHLHCVLSLLEGPLGCQKGPQGVLLGCDTCLG